MHDNHYALRAYKETMADDVKQSVKLYTCIKVQGGILDIARGNRYKRAYE
jgi:hypothetical protein